MDVICSQMVVDSNPDDKIWGENLFCRDRFGTDLKIKDKLAYNVIENIYGLVYLGMNFSMKRIGHDQLVNRFCHNDYLNKDMLIGLAIVNPVYFFCMMIGAMKNLNVFIAVIGGTKRPQ